MHPLALSPVGFSPRQSYHWPQGRAATVEGAGDMDYKLEDGLMGSSFKYNLYRADDATCAATAARLSTSVAQARKLLSPRDWLVAAARALPLPAGPLFGGGSDLIDKVGPPAMV